MKEVLQTWCRAFLEAIFPFHCHICKATAPWGQVLCQTCEKEIRASFLPPKLVTDINSSFEIWAMAPYQGIVAETIKIAKYHPSLKMALHLSNLAVDATTHAWPTTLPDVFIPVPLHPERESKRGFNQAFIYANAIAQAFKKPCTRALIRTKVTRPQAECSEQERATNLLGAFALAEGLCHKAFYNKRLCLIDDVVTTGATLAGCCEVLQILKPHSIIALTLAHPPRLFPMSQNSKT